MRKSFSSQQRLDGHAVAEVKLNFNCRDEIIPILAGLQHIYSQPQLRDEILALVAQDVNEHSRSDRGRKGLDYWHIIVLAAVRLGCNLDYDKLQLPRRRRSNYRCRPSGRQLLASVCPETSLAPVIVGHSCEKTP